MYQVLLQQRDHPSAEQVFLRAKADMPEISLATVYNCLDFLVQAGLVKMVKVDRAATRFCPNMEEHFHFHCAGCGTIFDVPFDQSAARLGLELPRGFVAQTYEVSVSGLCANCAAQ